MFYHAFNNYMKYAFPDDEVDIVQLTFFLSYFLIYFLHSINFS
jgi:hypothetical protein